MTLLNEILPQIARIGQTIGQFYCAVFTEVELILGTERAEIQAYLLTKVFIEAMLAAQRDKGLVTDVVLTQVLAQFHPKAGS